MIDLVLTSPPHGSKFWSELSLKSNKLDKERG